MIFFCFFIFSLIEIELIYGHKDKHGVPMGIKKEGCDTGEFNLKIDWDENPQDYVCFYPKNLLKVNTSIKSIYTTDKIEPDYMPMHICMTKNITYDENLPTFGDHRPLWPVYGEYKYLPVQRWLHSLEHGSIVMLYHPCANHMEVAKLRFILENCLRRHVITPNRYLKKHRPLALLAWGQKIEFNFVNQTELLSFIKEYSFKAPESFNVLQGQFEKELIKVSDQVLNSDYLDSNVCPKENFENYQT